MAHRIPIDTAAITFVAGEVSPLMDRETGDQRANPNGEPLFLVELAAFTAQGLQTWPVRVAGEEPKLPLHQPVKVHGLIATDWQLDGRAGVSFRADRIEPANGKAAAFSAPAKQDGQG